MSGKSKSTFVVLECNHHFYFRQVYAPKYGELVYCMKCEEYRHVGIAPVIGYRSKCEDCPYSRGWGADLRAASMAVTRHMRKNPSHYAIVLEVATSGPKPTRSA